MTHKSHFFILYTAVIVLAVAVIFNTMAINQLMDIAVQQGKVNGEVIGALTEQNALNDDQGKFNGEVTKTLGVMLR